MEYVPEPATLAFWVRRVSAFGAVFICSSGAKASDDRQLQVIAVQLALRPPPPASNAITAVDGVRILLVKPVRPIRLCVLGNAADARCQNGSDRA